MKKTLLILCALLLTAVGASAQTYKFVCTDWVSLDQNRATDSDIKYDEEANIITVVKTGDYNVALGNSTEMSQWGGITTENYTVSGWQHWFIVVGTNLSTTTADLWWMNGANYGEWDPTQVVELEDNQVLFAWDLSLMPAIDINLHNDVNYLNGWTGFGLTSTATDGTSTISDINFYTLEEAIEAYSELQGVLTETTTPYEFKNTDWVVLDDHSTTTTVATSNDGISVTYTGSEAGLGNMGTMGETGANTAGYYVTAEQRWFVIKGTGLSTTADDHLLWWMNGYNDGGSYVPTEVATLQDGSVVLAWDLSQNLGNYLLGKKNTLSAGTCFGLKSSTGSFTITDINFYTEEGFETLISAQPYTFNCKDWVPSDDNRATADKFTYDDTNNTITVASSGANNIAMGNSTEKSQWGGITTAAMTISKDQKWFVVIGTDISTTNATDSYLWWLNGTNKATQVEADKVVSLDDGSVLVAWDVTNSGLDDNLQDESNLLDGWTCFGLTSTGSSSTISYIGFYTDTQLDALVGIEWEMTPAGWGTLILPFAAEVPTDEEGEAALTLYAGDALELSSDGTAITVGTASETIEANTPYLVKGTAGTHTFTGTYEEATGALTSGLLTGTLVDMTYSDFATDGSQYVLQNHVDENGNEEDDGLAFYPITSASEGVTLSAYHCYLTLDNSTSPDGVRAFISLPGSDDVATAIEAVESDVIANDAIYDLSGRRVSKAVKGVYIQNGKKVLVK